MKYSLGICDKFVGHKAEGSGTMIAILYFNVNNYSAVFGAMACAYASHMLSLWRYKFESTLQCIMITFSKKRNKKILCFLCY